MESSQKLKTTTLLRQARTGSRTAGQEFVAELYQELRALAAGYFRRQRKDHTLQPTALVHEAFVRLIDHSSIEKGDRVHFLVVASKAMRQILVDHSRRKGAQKRGGDWLRVSLAEHRALAKAWDMDFDALEEALAALEKRAARKARVIELRFFAGLSLEEAAEVLGVSSKTVEADWYFARAWLRHELTRE